MALILDDVGYHIQLTKIDENQQEKMLFPVNTVQDVIIDDDGRALKEFVSTVDDDLTNPTSKEPFMAVSHGAESIPDSVFVNMVNA